MAARKKPNFSTRAPFKVSAKATAKHNADKNKSPLLGFGADPDFLPAQVRYDLHVAVQRSKLSPDQQLRLVEFANSLAQRPGPDVAPTGPQVEAFVDLAKHAHALLLKLNALSEPAKRALSLYSRDVCILNPSPLSFEMLERVSSLDEGEFLDECWEWANALDIVAEYASEELKPAKGDKQDETLARSMVAELAHFHIRMTGKRPPKDKASWFANFARVLGALMGTHFEDEDARMIKGKPFIGPGILDSGINLAERPITKGASPQEIRALNDAISASLAHDPARTDGDTADLYVTVEGTLQRAARYEALAATARTERDKALAAGDKTAADKYFKRANDWADRADRLRA